MTATLQDRINTLTVELVNKTKLLEDTRELLKRAEQESITLKATLEGVVNAKKTGIFHRIMGDIIEMTDNLKFQSPVIRKER